MNRISTQLYFTAIMTFFLMGCSGGGGGGKGSNPGGLSGPPPQTQEEAIQRLSPEHKMNFEAWKLEVIKSCNASRAFSGSSENQVQENGVDGAALLRQNNLSTRFVEGDKLVMVTGFYQLAGEGKSRFEETTSVNGQTYTISAEAKRNGSFCEVSLFGVKVFETYIARQAIIGFDYRPEMKAEVISLDPTLRTVGELKYVEARQHGLFNVSLAGLKPNASSVDLILRKLNLDPDANRGFFAVMPAPNVDLSIRVQHPRDMLAQSKELWNNSAIGTLIAPSSTISEIFKDQSTTQIEVVVAPVRFKFGEIENISDYGFLSFLQTVYASKIENSTQLKFNIQKQEKSSWNLESKERSEVCGAMYFTSTLGYDFTSSDTIQPSVYDLTTTCKPFDIGFFENRYESQFFRSRLKDVFAQVFSPGYWVNYSEWDTLLTQVALKIHREKKHVWRELDPQGKTLIIPRIWSHLTDLDRALDGKTKLTDLIPHLEEMVVGWTFDGIHSLQSEIDRIVDPLNNVADVFPRSSLKLVKQLSNDRTLYDGALKYAGAVTQQLKDEAKKARELAQELEYSDFLTNQYDGALQLQVPESEFRAWTQHLSQIKTELAQFPKLSPLKGLITKGVAKRMVNGSIDSVKLARILSSLNNSIDPFTASTRLLIEDFRYEPFESHQSALDYALQLTPEHKQLATQIYTSAINLGFLDRGSSIFDRILQNQPSLEYLRKQNEVWTSLEQFNTRELSRVASGFNPGAERNRKRVIEQALQEEWLSNDIAIFESVAQVAKIKVICERHPDMSSLADCVGLGYFSKREKKFLDPLFSGRYQAFAADFVHFLNRIDKSESRMLRFDFERSFFDLSSQPIWSKCDNIAFKQKSDLLRSQVDQLTQLTDPSKRFELERKLRENLRNCN